MSGRGGNAGASDAPEPQREVLDPRELFNSLAEARVDYILVGGLAVAAHGAPRATEDLDICPDPDAANLQRLADFLEGIEAKNMDEDEFGADELPAHDLDGLRAGGNFRLRTRLGRFDVMQCLRPFEDRTWEVLDRHAEERHVFGHRIRVCSYEHLLEMKRAADRDQDRIDINSIKAARREL